MINYNGAHSFVPSLFSHSLKDAVNALQNRSKNDEILMKQYLKGDRHPREPSTRTRKP